MKLTINWNLIGHLAAGWVWFNLITFGLAWVISHTLNLFWLFMFLNGVALSALGFWLIVGHYKSSTQNQKEPS